MTLPNAEVRQLLASRFVLAWRNIEKDAHVGLSRGYKPDQTAVGTTNGAGGRNVQLVVLAADETVVHVLPGFWHAEDLLAELQLALQLHALHRDEVLTAAQKETMHAVLHRAFVRRLSPATIGRSSWQGFDAWAERARAPKRDTFVLDEKGEPVLDEHKAPRLKAVVEVVHERLAARPFRKLANFGMEAFVDYGRAFYDNNEGLDKGRKFSKAEQANNKRAKEQARADKAGKPAKAGG